jgi:hypothetical protein
VIKAGEVHSFRAIGNEPLVHLDVHLHREFIQENLEPGPATPPPIADRPPHADTTTG